MVEFNYASVGSDRWRWWGPVGLAEELSVDELRRKMEACKLLGIPVAPRIVEEMGRGEVYLVVRPGEPHTVLESMEVWLTGARAQERADELNMLAQECEEDDLWLVQPEEVRS